MKALILITILMTSLCSMANGQEMIFVGVPAAYDKASDTCAYFNARLANYEEAASYMAKLTTAEYIDLIKEAKKKPSKRYYSSRPYEKMWVKSGKSKQLFNLSDFSLNKDRGNTYALFICVQE